MQNIKKIDCLLDRQDDHDHRDVSYYRLLSACMSSRKRFEEEEEEEKRRGEKRQAAVSLFGYSRTKEFVVLHLLGG